MPTPSDPLRVMVAGLGAFGGEHLGRLIGRADVTVVGIADKSPAALARGQRLHGMAECHDDPLGMIDASDADAVIVATPADAHVEIGMHALKRGLCVLLEKPIATSAAAGRALLEAEPMSTGFVLPGHVLRFSRDHQRLVEVVRSGQIGETIYVNSRRYRDDSHVVRYPADDPILMTLIHDIDLALWITGSDFRSVVARRVGGPLSRSITTSQAMTTNGVACELRTAWTFASGDLPHDRVEVVGARGSVELVVEEGLQVHCGGRRIDFLPSEADDSLSNEHEHFFSCVRNRSLKPAVDLRQAISGLRLADAMTESLRTGREVFLSD